jgi:putative RNA 2'-phosphotransferase
MPDDLVSTSKFLSLVLRHQPGIIGLTLDDTGWAEIDTLIRLSQPHRPLTRALIERTVEGNSKQRFAISDDGLRIRANQGHSIQVDLGFVPVTPPALLYHGTATRFLETIRHEGLVKRSRLHVHLSTDARTATSVGARHGKAAVLIVRAGEMAAAGHAFFRSGNGVWLTDNVPVRFIDFGNA